MNFLASAAIRLTFVGGGVAILYHETFLAEKAQWEVLLVALWMIGVPPSMWLDSVRDMLEDRRRRERRVGIDDRRSGDRRGGA